MDHLSFDHFARSLSAAGTRRGFVRLVAGLTLTDSFVAWLADEDGVDAAGRRHRRKKRHKHQKGDEKENWKGQRKGKEKGKAQGAKKHPRRGGAGRDHREPPPPQPPPPCVPECSATRVCGDDGCSGSCGQCATNETCQSGSCACVPDCTGKDCGGDGCGGSCGSCTGTDSCVSGTCRCEPQCGGKSCGSDSCGGTCGTCGSNEICESGSCLCAPDCGTKVCGNDGCGGSCGACTDQGAATCGTTGTCRGGDCERYASGTQCQAAVCTSETTLQPACTCDGQGACDCPGTITCPNDLVCRNGACLTSCGNDDDCGAGTCRANGTCTSTISRCECANLDYCNGNGHCTNDCTCVCHEGWTGASCDTPTGPTCSDHVTCQECANDIANACVFCSTTTGGATGVCVPVEQCAIAQDGC